jgi:gamma-tubulin complex component 4
MLHELLLALLGYTGDLIIHDHHKSLSPDSDDRPFKLAPDISFIEPSDRYLTLFPFPTLTFYSLY